MPADVLDKGILVSSHPLEHINQLEEGREVSIRLEEDEDEHRAQRRTEIVMETKIKRDEKQDRCKERRQQHSSKTYDCKAFYLICFCKDLAFKIRRSFQLHYR